MNRFIVRMLLTGAAWAVVGSAVVGAVLALGSAFGVAFDEVPDALAWFPVAGLGGVVFASASTALRASGHRWSSSRRVLGVIGAVALVAAVLIVDGRLDGALFGGAVASRQILWFVLVIGAVLGSGTLAVGGARE